MSTLHKVKAYFGMAPMDDYDDEYYDDHDDHDARDARDGRDLRGADTRGRGAPARRPERFDDGYDRRYEFRDDHDYDDRDPDYPPTGGFRPGYDDARFRPREFEHPHDMPRSRFAPLRGSTRGALAMDPRRMAMLFEEGSPLSKITTLRPKDYSEARTIGERFRDGQPVIMDLVSMDNADAKRLVDFAAGLAFALRGSFDKVATKVFLLAPPDVDVTAEERRRIAEAGFYSYQ